MSHHVTTHGFVNLTLALIFSFWSCAVTAAEEGTEIYLVQTKLLELGYQPGPNDGEIGPRTRAAIRAFQKAKNLTVTGEISDELMMRLGISFPGQSTEDVRAKQLPRLARSANVEGIRMLVDAGVDVTGRSGATALLIAVQGAIAKRPSFSGGWLPARNRQEMIKSIRLLLRAGADPQLLRVQGFAGPSVNNEMRVTGGVAQIGSISRSSRDGTIVEKNEDGLTALELAESVGDSVVAGILRQSIESQDGS